MKDIYNFILILLLGILTVSCLGESQTQIVKTPELELKASGPLYQGSNTATSTWKYNIEDIFTKVKGDVEIKNARVTAIDVMPRQNIDYPDLGKMVVEMKSNNTKMTRIGLLNNAINTKKTNNLNVADVQEDLGETFADEEIIFVGDIDLKEDTYYHDLLFDLVVTFEIETNK